MNLDHIAATTAQSVSQEIDARDDMFVYLLNVLKTEEAARAYYLDAGRELLLALAQCLVDSGRDPRTLDILDYAAGYGRVTRWLTTAFRSVTAADLERDMIVFHKRKLGVKGFVAPRDPAKLGRRGDYDVVFVFSLFTHLPEATWGPWLKALARLVRPGGALVFSTHSYEHMAKVMPQRFGDPSTWIDDFVFMPGNETRGRLSAKVYGSNVVTDAYVRRVVAEITGFGVARHYKNGEFDRYHDIYVLQRA